MSPEPPADTDVLRIAVLGPQAAALRQAVIAALQGYLAAPPSRPLGWLDKLEGPPGQAAGLCWLQAWEDGPDSADASLAALQAHQALRKALHAQGQAYLVLRGSLAQQSAQALQSLRPWLPELEPHLPRTGTASRRPGAWSCDTCGDADCEHASFTALLGQRGSA